MDANTQNIRLSNRMLVPSDGFSISGDIQTETDYNGNVIFDAPSSKPSWSDLQPKITEAQWNIVRAIRNTRLVQCDWTQLDDVALTAEKVEEWKVYRTALRDITTQSDPYNITWPTPPA
mgnify:CR=1 FL=1